MSIKTHLTLTTKYYQIRRLFDTQYIAYNSEKMVVITETPSNTTVSIINSRSPQYTDLIDTAQYGTQMTRQEFFTKLQEWSEQITQVIGTPKKTKTN